MGQNNSYSTPSKSPTRLVAEVFHSSPDSLVVRLLDLRGDDGMNTESDFRDVDVLLQMQQSHFQLRDLFLDGRSHLITISAISGSG